MYVLAARFRCAPKSEARLWQQHLLDHFFYDAEDKMVINHNMHARGIRNKYLKDLYVQWRGLLAAYDEGLAKGDAVLAAAIWRNVFKADEEVDIRKLAQIVSYVRRLLRSLDSLQDNELISVEFGDVEQEGDIVRLKSPMMDLPFTTGSRSDLPQGKREL
jgi:cytochrome b pre-mRNA-processing protein 3